MSDFEPTQEEITPLEEETAIDQRIVPFMGDELVAAMTASEMIYISLNGLCTALGVNYRAQLLRSQRTPTLARGLRRIPLKTSGGVQRISCLRVDKVALWLAGIEPGRIKEQFRAKIEAYQDELAPVAMRVFMRVMGIPAAPPATADPRMAALAEQYDVLMGAATFISEHMDDLAGLPGQVQGVSKQLAQAVRLLESLAAQQETTATTVQQIKQEQKLTPAQKQHIKDAVNKIADDSAGKSGEMKHSQIYAAIYKHFHVSAYAEIPAARYDEVIMFLRNLWKSATTGTPPEQKSFL
jgi:hypothetical protein